MDVVRVLLVEDDPDDAFLIERRLRSDDGHFVVDHVVDLSEASERLAAADYDVILLDLGLPGSDGIDTIQRLAAIGTPSAVVVMTGAEEADLARSSFELGVNDYLSKSAAATELLPRVLVHAVERESAKGAIAARMAAEEANLAKSAFLSRVSHELRTPLHAIMGFAQLLESEATTADDLEATGIIVKASEHLLALITDVLDISRIETGDLRLLLEPVAVHDIVREAADLMGAGLGAARLDVPLGDIGVVYVLGDRHRIRQVLLNLLSNALKYGPHDGIVKIRTTSNDDGYVEISVIDDGPGIPDDAVDAVFAPFERLGQESGAVEGAGLGLALSRELIGAMRGTIGVRSTPGEGATFWFALPATTP